MEVKLPYLGDGVDSATVLSIMVAVGDSIQKEQTLFELETDKAVAPIPSEVAGKVTKILIKEGDTVRSGTPVLEVEGGNTAAQPAQAKAPEVSSQPVPTPVAQDKPAQIKVSSDFQLPPDADVATSPFIRRAAKVLGLDLRKVPGTGRSGRITLEDVQAYLYTVQNKAESLQSDSAPAPAAKKAAPKVDFEKWGTTRREKISSLRKKISDNMVNAWNTIPHVTQFDDADITEIMNLRKKHNPKYQKKNAKLTVTSFAIKSVCNALEKHPIFNASLDESENELVYKDYINIGIAVDTPNGLIVPVIKNANKKSLLELTLELNELAEKARDRKLTLDDIQGATFTITNLGGLGVGAFTPIINPPEVAILALSKGSQKAVYNGTTFEPRLTLPLGLSYDHRVIDGADAARFIREVIEDFENFNEKLLKI